MRKPRICLCCNATYIPSRHDSKFCSKKCAWKVTKGPAYNAMIARVYRGKNGDSQRGRGEGKAYRKLNGRHEHRVVAEQKLGRPLGKGEIVHHVDGNKLNNHPDNLEVMTQREHMQIHGLGIKGVPLAHKPWEKRYGRS